MNTPKIQCPHCKLLYEVQENHQCEIQTIDSKAAIETQKIDGSGVSPNTNIDEQVNILNILMYLQTGKTDIEAAAKSIEALLSAAKIETAKEVAGTIKIRKLTGDEITSLVENYIKELEKS